MALQYAANSRLVTYDKNICPQCSAWLLAPDWSEHFNERCVRPRARRGAGELRFSLHVASTVYCLHLSVAENISGCAKCDI